jgi:hypothetical protein
MANPTEHREDAPFRPEQEAPPKQKPDVGSKPDMKYPEQPEQDPPKKPIPDMDPPGQDGESADVGA